jgi:polyphenol oxidase
MARPSLQAGFKIPFIQSSVFADRIKDGIAHGFFGRRGGVSKSVFESLNCGPGSGDNPDDVRANRKLVADALGAAPEKLLSLYQIHSAECLSVLEPWGEERPQADGMVTDIPGIVLSILTADCAPVLFCGWAGDKPVIGAAHAGWKGAIVGVLERTVEKMVRDYGVDIESIRACIGPCIQKKSYEVSQEFYETFMEQDGDNEKFFQGSRKDGHFMFDLPRYCGYRLYNCGVQRVLIEEANTYVDEAAYFSFRRATHRQEKDYGRQISAIFII